MLSVDGEDRVKSSALLKFIEMKLLLLVLVGFVSCSFGWYVNPFAGRNIVFGAPDEANQIGQVNRTKWGFPLIVREDYITFPEVGGRS